jgi:general secretion pathway protein F
MRAPHAEDASRGQIGNTLSAAGTKSSIRLRVAGPNGQSRTLDLPDMTAAQARRHAALRGLQVIAVEESAGKGTEPAPRGGRFPLLLFTQELLALIEAGLNLTEALVTLRAKERQATALSVIEGLLQRVREGRSFSDALEMESSHFPPVYVATVRASERTGDLPRALKRFIDYQLQFDIIRKKLVSAAIYPAMLLVVGGFVTLFLLGYVVPRFSTVYESAGRDIPWMSSLLLTFGQAISNHWPLALGGLAVGLSMIGWLIGTEGGRAMVERQLVRLPWLARQAEDFRLARFYRAASLLLAAGIALPRALRMVDGLLSVHQQARLELARQAVEQGQPLSAALVEARLVSPVAESLIKVGERSGQLGDMLERTAKFHDEEFGRWVDWASRLLEPLLMTFIGLVIGTVVVLMYMPIFELAGSLQ